MTGPLRVLIPGALAALWLAGATAQAGDAAPAAAATTMLKSFAAASQGSSPRGSLVADASGALYGAAQFDGPKGQGTIFRLSPPVPPKTAWKLAILYSFDGGPKGGKPVGDLAIAPNGTLYGATLGGGNANGDGTVFRLKPPAGGQGAWAFTVLHSFGGFEAGSNPFAGLVRAADGTLYGTTAFGGDTGWGTVFSLTPPSGNGGWTHKVLYHFLGTPDAGSPKATLTLGADGALYGTTKEGGNANLGTVFRLAPPAAPAGAWKRTILHHFKGAPNDGAGPLAGVAFDAAGDLYGTASFGGRNANAGTVFRLVPPPSGNAWAYRTLHHFDGDGGQSPQGNLAIDPAGRLFGTTAFGGAGSGVVFRLTPPQAPQTKWKRTVLHAFAAGPGDGAIPLGGVLRRSGNVMFGATGAGGANDAGAIYRIGP